jgi:hypothetical protein
VESNLEYLGRNLNRRKNDAAVAIELAIETVMRTNSAAGRLASGSSLISIKQEVHRVFQEQFDDAVKFAFNLMGTNNADVVNVLTYFAGSIEKIIMDKVRTSCVHLGLSGADVAPHVMNMQLSLEGLKERLVDDFSHGMSGSSKLEKDPVVSIVSHQTNSPGAVQQIGVGNFSQTAFAQQHQQLVEAIDRALQSQEFDALDAHSKEGFKDIADTLIEEASKPQPNPGKLKRWGTRLSEFGLQVGMRVASDEIIHVIGKMFGAS